MEKLSHKGFSILHLYLLVSEVSGLGCVGGRIFGHKWDQIIRYGFLFKFNGLKERESP